ncbi:MAG: protein kinase [Thermoanaerobaculia bacterium]|nr:protein kinase [Thermoanaerobaculia bacterium]
MKFLLIEYEPRYLERIRQYLAGQSQTVELVMARDGEEGLDLYRKSRPDLVLISSVLPKLRTPDVIKGMQAMGPTPPVLLMMSGYKGRNKRADAQRVGATSILEKPFSEDVFQAEVAMALGLRPAIEAPPSSGPPSDPGAPLLSADDIFSDVLTGLDEAPPARPVSREMPVPAPAIDKRLHDTLSGLLPPRKTPSGVSAPFPAAEVPGNRPDRPVERTARVNVAEAMASLSARPQPAPRSGESPARSISSVDKLLHDTLSGLLPPPKTSAPGSPAPPARPREPKSASREVSGETVRMKVAPLPPSVPPAPPPMPRPVDATRPVPAGRPASSPGAFGRYQLLQKIGAGGMAEVFKARMSGERGFEKIVAIKRIVPHMATNAEFVTMFVDEAKLAAQLNHNNITHIYDLGKVDAWHYIAMEYVEGKDLRTLLKLAKERTFPLPAELALFIASKIANALDYAHRRPAPDGSELNLVHRDVSPQNILLSDEGDIKLCDFGIAKAASKVSTTMSGALKGKLQYMSPEQAWGKRVDRRSDIFSLGSVLYEMLTGAPLFGGDTDMSVLENVREGEVAPPTSRGATVPKRVDQILLKALAKNPQERYQNASEFEKDLHAVLYTYQPAPGPADLAIYMHRLLEAPQASDAEIDAAFDAARDMPRPTPSPAPAPAVPSKKGKGLVISKTGEFPRPASAPEPRPEPAPRRAVGERVAALPAAGESRKSRTGLVAGIGLAAVALLAGGLFVTKDRWFGDRPSVTASAPRTEPAAVSASSAVPRESAPPPAPEPAPAEPAKVIDTRAVEAEARRLGAEREKALRDAAKPGTAGKPATASVPPAAVVGLAPVKAAEPPRPAEVPTAALKSAESVSTAVPVSRPPEPKPAEPVAEAPKSAAPPPVEVSVPDPAPAIPVVSSAPVKEGDLVGPGDGVVEPRLVRLGSMVNLPVQARQIKRGADGSIGTPFLMALIDERGTVQEVRVLKPSNYKFVDEAAVRSLKGATIQPATKDGVKVKMWKAFPITVKP